MNARTTQQTVALATILSAALLGGCLSDEKSDADFAGSSIPTQNNPPSISANLQNAVMMGDTYSLTPIASDPDGDTLTFSVQNRPVWANFDSSTGRMSGTPTLADVGTYADIVISVSDGSLSASLPQFSVDVVQSALGSVTLSFTPPIQNEDGSTLDNLVAYKFYYGTESGTYTNSIRVDDSGLASYVVENLTPNTYYFAATAISGNGVESGFSNETIKEVP